MENPNQQKLALRTLIGIGVVGFFAQAAWATLNFSALPMWIEFHLHQAPLLGIVISSVIVPEASLRPIMGGLSDRIGRRPVMMLGPFIGIFTSIASVFMPTALLLIPLRIIDGIGLAGFWPSGYAIIGDFTGEERRGTGASVLNGSGMAGVALGWLAGGAVNQLTGTLSAAFYFVSLMFLITVIAALVLLPEPRHRHHHAEVHEGSGRIRDILKTMGEVPDMIVLNLVMFAGVGLLMPIFKLYAVQHFKLTELVVGAVVAPAALVLGLISLPLGRLADKWGPLVSVRYGVLACAVGMWIVASSHGIRQAMVGAAFIGAGFMAAYPAWMAVISSSVPESRRGQVLGAVGMAEGIGAVIGVIIGPILYNEAKGLPFWASAILLSVATVVAFTWVTFRRRRGLI